jgi:L-arabinonolactonase
MTTDLSPHLAVDCHNFLGESCVWDDLEGLLYWVDVQGAQIWQYNPATGNSRSFQMPGRMGAIALRRKGGLVAALEDGVAAVNLDSCTFERLVDIVHPGSHVRLNDSRVDRSGRFICGAMDEDFSHTTSVYRVDADHTAHPIIEDVGIANSICFSPDGSIMYFADTRKDVIVAYDYDQSAGVPHDPKLFVDLADQPGHPDGSTVDAEGFVWNGQFGGGRVVRYAPDGGIDTVVEVPVSNATCICFGGAGLSTMFITTARIGLSSEALEQQPSAGGLYSLDTESTGLPESRFAG